jgi:hypothetical protein
MHSLVNYSLLKGEEQLVRQDDALSSLVANARMASLQVCGEARAGGRGEGGSHNRGMECPMQCSFDESRRNIRRVGQKCLLHPSIPSINDSTMYPFQLELMYPGCIYIQNADKDADKSPLSTTSTNPTLRQRTVQR